MSHCTCGCGHGVTPLTITFPTVGPDTTVAEVKDRPGAMDVLQRFGLNHCCGAHLTLRESAASAGARLDDVLEALARAGGRS
jgi:iron-sulfur cluster repair protein YtfE (RIC family)